MTLAALPASRVIVAGKFFRLGEKKFFAKGMAYGPLAPNAAGDGFASPEQTGRDFTQIQAAGANLVRVYHVPPKWLLDLAAAHGLKVLVDVPWNQHLCFMDSRAQQAEARAAVRNAVLACGGHPAVFAFSVANEIPSEIVRWSGARQVANFIDTLIAEAKRADPLCLCTFTNFPPTEFLRPLSPDFLCFNVYLHQKAAFRSYLARLQMHAVAQPLLLGELGIDSLREGEERKCEMLGWQLETVFRAGAAGAVVFSFTDDWWRAGFPVSDWQMGLTTPNRTPKPSLAAVQKTFGAAPFFPLPRTPKVSVVVACYNGERTLAACLDSLQRLNYPDYEVIVVDDGSADATPQLAFSRPAVRYFRHEKNLGLSVARNTGIAAATGDIIAFTDSDCRADEDWLYYLVSDLLDGGFAGIGGPNLLPPDDSAVAAAVMASPGGPAHVMLSDRQAEHVPGCNMAFFKWALEQIGGFDPVFRIAGDDVDVCWRLQQAGYQLGFSPAALVWHYRRSTVGEYLRQQHGYGEAEALLVRKHPEYFNSFGGSLWHGRIYSSAKAGVLLRPPIIYRGLLGSAGFQAVYAAEPAGTLMLSTTIEYHVLVTLPLCILSAHFHWLWPLALASLAFPLAICAIAGAQAELPRDKTGLWSRPLVALLFFLQPIVRGWARYQGRFLQRASSLAARQSLDSLGLRASKMPLKEVDYWSSRPVNRFAFVAEVLRRLEQQGWPHKADVGWCEYDLEIYGGRWSSLQLTTVTEDQALTKHLLRCRLGARWSFPAKVAFWALAAFEFLLLGFAGRWSPWLWLALLTLPLLAWFIHHEERTLRSTIIVFLDALGKDLELAKQPPESVPQATPAPASPAASELNRQTTTSANPG